MCSQICEKGNHPSANPRASHRVKQILFNLPHCSKKIRPFSTRLFLAVYVENGAQTANTVLTFDVKGAGSSWNIKVNQIACDSEMRPPTGCLQYYTGIGGTFKSLGHGDSARMLQEDYVICFRREEGRCQIGNTQFVHLTFKNLHSFWPCRILNRYCG